MDEDDESSRLASRAPSPSHLHVARSSGGTPWCKCNMLLLGSLRKMKRPRGKAACHRRWGCHLRHARWGRDRSIRIRAIRHQVGLSHVARRTHRKESPLSLSLIRGASNLLAMANNDPCVCRVHLRRCRQTLVTCTWRSQSRGRKVILNRGNVLFYGTGYEILFLF